MPSNTSKNSVTSPILSFIIPTLNSQAVLPSCLASIKKQNYKNYEILIIDGGSTDKTLNIATDFNCRLIKNPLKTAEAAKALGFKSAKGDFIALIDSDNILPDKFWLDQMLKPLLSDPTIIGSEPIRYTYRPDGGFIERYSALTGVNDPYTLIAGNYDRLGYLNPTWTGLKLKIVDFPDYQVAQFLPNKLLPTVGANGTVFRNTFLLKFFKGKYFFDIDIISRALKTSQKLLLFSKVKVGIIHSFCESSISKFYRKQKRRAVDLYVYRSLRAYPLTQNNFLPSLHFCLYVALLVPMLFDTAKGFIKKPDPAWLFHPLACILTLYCYAMATMQNSLGLLRPLSRQSWKQ